MSNKWQTDRYYKIDGVFYRLIIKASADPVRLVTEEVFAVSFALEDLAGNEIKPELAVPLRTESPPMSQPFSFGIHGPVCGIGGVFQGECPNCGLGNAEGLSRKDRALRYGEYFERLLRARDEESMKEA